MYVCVDPLVWTLWSIHYRLSTSTIRLIICFNPMLRLVSAIFQSAQGVASSSAPTSSILPAWRCTAFQAQRCFSNEATSGLTIDSSVTTVSSDNWPMPPYEVVHGGPCIQYMISKAGFSCTYIQQYISSTVHACLSLQQYSSNLLTFFLYYHCLHYSCCWRRGWSSFRPACSQGQALSCG